MEEEDKEEGFNHYKDHIDQAFVKLGKVFPFSLS